METPNLNRQGAEEAKKSKVTKRSQDVIESGADDGRQVCLPHLLLVSLASRRFKKKCNREGIAIPHSPLCCWQSVDSVSVIWTLKFGFARQGRNLRAELDNRVFRTVFLC